MGLRASGALSWQELHGLGLPGLWPLVALTRDGASAEGVRQARDAIQGRSELGAAGRADHLAVLSFVAEAEGVAMRALSTAQEARKLLGKITQASAP